MEETNLAELEELLQQWSITEQRVFDQGPAAEDRAQGRTDLVWARKYVSLFKSMARLVEDLDENTLFLEILSKATVLFGALHAFQGREHASANGMGLCQEDLWGATSLYSIIQIALCCSPIPHLTDFMKRGLQQIIIGHFDVENIDPQALLQTQVAAFACLNGRVNIATPFEWATRFFMHLDLQIQGIRSAPLLMPRLANTSTLDFCTRLAVNLYILQQRVLAPKKLGMAFCIWALLRAGHLDVQTLGQPAMGQHQWPLPFFYDVPNPVEPQVSLDMLAKSAGDHSSSKICQCFWSVVGWSFVDNVFNRTT